jgi:hypothetical protein
VKTVLEEPQDLAANLGGVAEYRGAPVGAIGSVGRRGLAPMLPTSRAVVIIRSADKEMGCAPDRGPAGVTPQ